MILMTAGNRLAFSTALIPAIAIAALFVSSAACADQSAEYWQKGEELYETHHLGPDRFDQALEWYEKAIALRPNDYELLWEMSKRYQIYGQALGDNQKKEKLEHWEEGVEYGRRAVKADPDGKEGHFYYMANIGAIAQLKGILQSIWKLRKIKREMDRTLEIDPNYPPALLARAQFLMEMPGVFGGDKQEAMRLCERVIRLDPDHLPTYIAMARLLAAEGRYDEAVENLNKVLLCEQPRQEANYLKVDRPRAETALEEIMRGKSRKP
jgi:tetratricopeptide (TPR) repeat protein